MTHEIIAAFHDDTVLIHKPQPFDGFIMTKALLQKSRKQ